MVRPSGSLDPRIRQYIIDLLDERGPLTEVELYHAVRERVMVSPIEVGLVLDKLIREGEVGRGLNDLLDIP